MIKLTKEMVGRRVLLANGETEGSILAYLESELRPYCVMVKKPLSTHYYFCNDTGHMSGVEEPIIQSVLDVDSSEINFKNENITNHTGDSNSDIETKQNTSNCAGKCSQKASGPVTLTLTLPEGTNALEGEFKANNGKTYKVKVKHGR
jgi:hypothetical protein